MMSLLLIKGDSLIERLPNEILGKIIAYLPIAYSPDVVNRTDTQRGVVLALRDRKSLKCTSRRMYTVVRDVYVTALFICAVLEKGGHKGLLLTDFRALEIGVWKYVRDFQLERLTAWTKNIYRFTYGLVQRVNALYQNQIDSKIGVVYFDSLPFSLGPPTTLFSMHVNLNTLRIVGPVAEICVEPILRSQHRSEICLTIFALAERLIRVLGATFEGFVLFDSDPLLETTVPCKEGMHSVYIEIVHPSNRALWIKKTQLDDIKIISKGSVMRKKGTHNLILSSDYPYFSVYRVRCIDREVLPRQLHFIRPSRFVSSFLAKMVHLMIRNRGVIPVWLKEQRMHLIKNIFLENTEVNMHD